MAMVSSDMVFSRHFFWGPLSTINAESHVQVTNLHNVVQNIDERVTILEPDRRHLPP
jgi:hypothetical protein